MSGANRIPGAGRLTPAKTARFTFDGKSYTALEGDTAALGKMLFTQYVLPFEVVSVLLLVAMVGVILLSKKKLE